MNISIPDLSLVVLVGPSGSGKTTFAARHFLPTEVLSSDACRGWVSDDPNHQAATKDAFEVLHYIAGKRLAAGRLTVVDATSVQPEARRPLVRLAKEHHVLPVAIVLNLPEKICSARNQDRPERQFGPRVIRHQRSQLQRSLRGLRREGFRQVHVLDEPEAIDQVQLTRTPLWCDRRNECGPFDVIGDVHGCGDELESLLGLLGYEPQLIAKEPGWLPISYAHPDGRRAVFVGDLVDRGPRCLAVLSIVRNMMRHTHALCVPGNHDEKLLRWLRGRKVKVAYGLAETIAQIEAVPNDEQETFKAQLIEFLDGLVSHCVLDGGKLVVAHAGMPEHLQGRASGRVRELAMYGETTGEIDEFGLPVRYNWAADYRGSAMVVYGHTPHAEARWLNRTINVDTGCVFGGRLTALRYPEETLVSTPARQVYCESARPLHPQGGPTLQQQSDHLLDAADVLGKRIISTRLRNNITIREENAMAAWEVMSRFAVDPKWLIYLPPTMSPSSGTSPSRR